ncbi:MAG TPA: hypothetical protein DCY88_04230 [Cyanobacteria bacterium UBA11372]|nr:hypothetical protein [Cyanobacteria bacterium UBA11372]
MKKLYLIAKPHSLLSRWQQPKWIVIGLIGINLCITLFLSATLNIWIDEAFSLHTTGQDFYNTLNQALYFELQPPAYFLILNLWRQLNSSIFFARLFSIVCIVLTLAIVPKLSQKYLPDIHPGWITAAVALNPFTIWAAVEIRVYAFVILLSALLMLFFFDGYLSEQPNTLARWAYVEVAILGLYTQYFIAFLLVAQGIAFLVFKGWRALRKSLLEIIVVVLGFLPILLIVPHQISEHTTGVPKTFSISESLRVIMWNSINYIFPINWTWLRNYQDNNAFLYTLACLIFGLMFLIYRKPRWLKQQDIALWIMASVTIVFLAGVFIKVTGAELIETRHTSVLFIPVVFSAFSIIKAAIFPWLKSSYRLKILLILSLVILFFNITSLGSVYRRMTKPGDASRVANYITIHEKPNQPILVFPGLSALTLSYHYSGQNSLVPIPRGEDFQNYNLRKFVLKEEREILAPLSQVTDDPQSIWIVVQQKCTNLNIDFNCQLFHNFINRHYSTELSKEFRGTTVKLLHRKPHN